ncbi:metal-dependent hydrolase [Halosimplex sp. TS25]|uniref:metal-dependent hydrolase n=1 Tax=Halosimplex rarum TaxID=3396619 RepID=UPI0039EB55D9
MADLLTHVLAVYVLLTVASWRFESLTPRWVAVGMCGGAIPDLVKTELVLDSAVVEGVLGVQFSYGPVSTLGGVLLIAAAITLVFARRHWRHAYAFLVVGGVTSLVLDGLRVYADGRAGPWLYPFTWWRPPTPSLYVTSDPRIVLVAIAVAGVVFAVDRNRGDATTEDRQNPIEADP